MKCPCGSQKLFAHCCEPIIKGNSIAQSPEQLMRSRYSAYAIQHSEYIFNTYSKDKKLSQSVAEIHEWALQTTWLSLTIVSKSDFTQHDTTTLPTVEFSAIYLHEKQFCCLHENSRFIQEEEHWRYVDGNIISHQILKAPKRNQPCICGSTRKYKHCCAIKIT